MTKDYYNINGTCEEGTEGINRNRVTSSERGDESGAAELLTTTWRQTRDGVTDAAIDLIGILLITILIGRDKKMNI